MRDEDDGVAPPLPDGRQGRDSVDDRADGRDGGAGEDPVAPPPPPPPPAAPPPPLGGWGDDAPAGRDRPDGVRAPQGRRPPMGSGRPVGPRPPEGLRPMTLADVLDGTFRLIKDHWRAYLLAVGGVLVPLSLLSNILIAAVAPEFIAPDVATLFDPEQLEAGEPLFDSELVIAGLVAGAVGFLFTTPISWSVATTVAGAGVRGETAEPGPAIRTGLRRWPSVLAVIVLQALAYLAAAVVVGLLTASAVATVGGAGGLVVLPLLLLWIVFVAWLYTRWALSVPVAVLEQAGPLRALRRSWSLTNTRFWWLLGTLVLTLVMATIVGSIASTPLQLVALAPGLSTFLAALVVSLGSVVSGLVSTPVTVNALTLLYTDRRVRREGVDLVPGGFAGDGSPGRPGGTTGRGRPSTGADDPAGGDGPPPSW